MNHITSRTYGNRKETYITTNSGSNDVTPPAFDAPQLNIESKATFVLFSDDHSISININDQVELKVTEEDFLKVIEVYQQHLRTNNIKPNE